MLTTEERRNQPPRAHAEREQLIEVGRRTSAVTAHYQMARAAFLAAAQELNVHCDRWEKRRDEFEAAGGDLRTNRAAEFAEPQRPQPVTADDLRPL